MRRSLVRLVAVVLVAGLLVLVRPVPVGATASAVDRYRDVVLDDDPVAFWQMQELFDMVAASLIRFCGRIIQDRFSRPPGSPNLCFSASVGPTGQMPALR